MGIGGVSGGERLCESGTALQPQIFSLMTWGELSGARAQQ
jgi:hypothetical protein